MHKPQLEGDREEEMDVVFHLLSVRDLPSVRGGERPHQCLSHRKILQPAPLQKVKAHAAADPILRYSDGLYFREADVLKKISVVSLLSFRVDCQSKRKGKQSDT